MNPPPRARLLLRALIVLAVGTVLVSASLRLRPTAAAPPSAPGRPRASAEAAGGIVCFGTVDIEGGVASLGTVQPGRVAEVLVREGQEVARGVALLLLEDGDARDRLAEADAAVELARLQLHRAREQVESHRMRIEQQQAMLDAMHSRVESARRVLEREERLAKSHLITDSDRSISREKVRETEALERAEARRLAELKAPNVQLEVRRAEIELKSSEARLREARRALEECTLRAPRAGTILRITVGPGDVLGVRPDQPAVLFAADGPRVVRATVEQEFAGRVREGDSALVEDEADPAATWRGRVGRVAGWYSQRRTVLHDPAQMTDVRTLECLIILEPGSPRLRLGQAVRVLIGTEAP